MRFNAADFLAGLFRQGSCSPAEGGPEGAGTVPDPRLAPADLPPEWHFLWDERAAIKEYQAGVPRERAEAEALTEILDLMARDRQPRLTQQGA